MRFLDKPLNSALLLAAVAVAPGCAVVKHAPRRSAPSIGNLPAVQARLSEEAQRPFERAVMYKPRDELSANILPYHAPLIVWESQKGASDAVGNAPFGAVAFDRNGEIHVDSTQPTVYVYTNTVKIQDEQAEEIGFLWWERPGTGNARPAVPRLHGIRITQSDDGFPLVWEVLGNSGPYEPVYVSISFERRANAAFGPALPGRSFAAEKSRTDAPRTVVVRVLDDGPVPMGPYIYVDAANGDVTTLLCRCMASQVESFTATTYYDLVPLEGLGDWESVLAAAGVDWPAAPIHRRLRWPGASHESAPDNVDAEEPAPAHRATEAGP